MAKTLEGGLPERVEITPEILAEARANGTHLGLALKLYAEAGVLVTICSAAFTAPDSELRPTERPALGRDHAIAAALLARLGKFMYGVLHLAMTGGFGEIVLALNRCILETSVNVSYLCQTDDPKRYDRFVADGLTTERDLYDKVQSNIASRGNRLPIEERMLAGVRRVFEESDVPLESVKPRAKDLDYASRLRALGMEEGYVFMQRLPSAAVHGTWLDLLHHHITNLGDGRFQVRYDKRPMDVRLLCPIVIVASRAARDFVSRHLSASPDAAELDEILADLQARAAALDASHEQWKSGSITDGGPGADEPPAPID